MKTYKLTKSQEKQLEEYRDEIFQYAVSTETNKEKAEKAALELTKDVLKNPEIHWVTSPEEGKKLYDSLGGSLYDFFWDSLSGSLQKLLNDSLQKFLSDSFDDFFWYSFDDFFWYSLVNFLSDSWRYSLVNFLYNSLKDFLRDSGWVAFYRFPEKIGIVKYEEKESKMLKCYEELLQSCFAIYVLPGHIILVEKPKKTEVKEGKLIHIEW